MLGMDAKVTAPSAQFLSSPLPHSKIAALLLLLMGAAVWAANKPEPVDALWDNDRYIGIEEIEPGMSAYCLTDYGVNGVEKFDLEVVNVIHDYEPGRDAILVMGLDERFKHTGVVAGCSGSPVYIDGRLAGAMSFGWSYSKDPLYGVTPIREMLQVGTAPTPSKSGDTRKIHAFTFDLSKPIDLSEISDQVRHTKLIGTGGGGASTGLALPLLVSGLSEAGCERVVSQLTPLGFAAAPGLSGSTEPQDDPLSGFKPGSTLTIPLVAGDIKMNVLGTVTEIRDDRVYAFGHSFIGYGPLRLPMAGGKVYTVISSLSQSSKLGAATEIIGSIVSDEASAIYGKIGSPPKMIPLSIRIDRFNDPLVRTYNCQVVEDSSLTPELVPSALDAAALQVGDLPPDHTVVYDATVKLKDGKTIHFGNLSTGLQMSEPISEMMSVLVLLLNNPFKTAEIESVDFQAKITPDNLESHLWSLDVTDTTVKPGEDIDVTVVLENYLASKKRYHLTLTVPEDVAPGKYTLQVCGAYDYEAFLRRVAPNRFLATNYETLTKALKEALSVERTRLYCCLTLPTSGIMLERANLPDLPETKALIFENDGRALKAQPHAHWIETSAETGTVVADRQTVPIVVEEK